MRPFCIILPRICVVCFSAFFFFTDTATTEIYTLSLHDALPISRPSTSRRWVRWTSTGPRSSWRLRATATTTCDSPVRSEEHTSELQSHSDLVCRLLLEKKKTTTRAHEVHGDYSLQPSKATSDTS